MTVRTHRRGRRGRPPGPTAKSAETRRRLFDAAIDLFASRGYQGTTMRDIAAAADASPGLTYRYFSAKEEIVLELYLELSERFRHAAPAGTGDSVGDGFAEAMRLKFELLAPYRAVLAALFAIGIDPASRAYVLGDGARAVRSNVTAVMENLIPAHRLPQPTRTHLAEVLFVLQMAVVFCWLHDRSRDQRATHRLVSALGRLLTVGYRLVRVPGIRRSVDALAAALRPIFNPEAGVTPDGEPGSPPE